MADEVRIIGRSNAHQAVLGNLENAARTDVEVVVSGPTGVGKELYARWLHARSSRSEKAFVAVNCGAVPGALFENEMFGHVGGAYTGARTSSAGLIAEAENGSLFLDEIDALELSSQVKLLRFLQQREYRRLGEPRVRKANVRVVCATNCDLRRAVKDGRFREDLFFRIHVFPIAVPPLRDRPEDVEPLLAEYVDRYAGLYSCAPLRLTGAALLRLESYSWPGNVRELENCVRYLTALRLDRPIEESDLRLHDDDSSGMPPAGSVPPAIPGPSPRGSSGVSARSLASAKSDLIRQFEKSWLIGALRAANGNIARAARESGKPRRSFFQLLRKHGIRARDFAAS